MKKTWENSNPEATTNKNIKYSPTSILREKLNGVEEFPLLFYELISIDTRKYKSLNKSLSS